MHMLTKSVCLSVDVLLMGQILHLVEIQSIDHVLQCQSQGLQLSVMGKSDSNPCCIVKNMTQTEVMGAILARIKACIELNTNSTSDAAEEKDLKQHSTPDQAEHSNLV